MADLIRDTAVLGYVIGAALVALGLAVLVIMFIKGRSDDGFSPIGVAAPPPPRVSPFARPRDSHSTSSPAVPGESLTGREER